MILVAVLLALLSILLYLYHVSHGMSQVPEEARRFSPHRWTVDEIKSAYSRNVNSPIDVVQHLPPKQNRRYVVVGAAGLVGNWIVTHLLARGEDPAAIRVLDLQAPRQDILDQGVVFAKTNVTDQPGVSAAFAQPWPSSAAHLPLTVFHTAAVIRPAERHKVLLPFCTTVNVRGTRNVLEAAKEAGADCFIATSSGSIGLRRPSFWIAPWTHTAPGLVQVLSDHAKNQPKEHDEFFGNYAVSKAQAEELVREADDAGVGFRTGCIRPSNGIYGIGGENSASVGRHYLQLGGVPTWTSSVIQNFVCAENVSIAHLLYEQRLVSPASKDSNVDIGGQSFVITDPNPPIAFSDLYRLLSTLSKTPTHFTIVSGMPLFLFSYLIEWYILLQYRYLSWILPPVTDKGLLNLQPALFAVCNPHTFVDDSRAREKPENGGLGYSAPITTLDGFCREVEEWNRKKAKSAS